MICSEIVKDTPTLLLSAPADLAVTLISFTNLDEKTVDAISVYVVPKGGVIENKNLILKDNLIPAGGTFLFNVEKLLLSKDDRIYAACRNGKMSSIVSYLQL